MRSAPAPDLLPIPGMNQGTAVAAGDGGSGGDDGDGGDGNDKEGAGGENGGEDADGDVRCAEGEPVDAVTGRVYTFPAYDLRLPGPLPINFERSYSTTALHEDHGLGFGWNHSFSWTVEVRHRFVRVWDHRGMRAGFELPPIGHARIGERGWVLRREPWGFAVDAGDNMWRLFSTTFDEGQTFQLTAVEDRNKNRISLTYDAGKLIEIVDSVGRLIRVTSSPEGRIASLQAKNAEQHGRWIAFARYEYDNRGRLIRVQDADDYSWTYQYDEYDRLTKHTDRNGLSFCYRYDARDRGIETWGEYSGQKDESLEDEAPAFLADGTTRAKGILHRKLDYHDRGYTEVTDSTTVRRYFGNRRGKADKVVTGGSVTSVTYDEQGFVLSRSNPMGATWTWTRDRRGRVASRTDPLGRQTVYERDEHGLVVRMVDPAGCTYTATRDRKGNAETTRDPAGNVSQFTHDQRGMLTSATDALGATTNLSYDSHGNLIEFAQSNGGVWRFRYDGLGRLLSRTDPMGAETRFSHSDRGDLVAVYHAGGTSTRYRFDGERRVIHVESPQGATTHFRWAGFQQVVSRRDANGHLVRMKYSREGELLAIFDELDRAHRLEYDNAGRLVAEHTIDGRTLRYHWDAADRPIRIERSSLEIDDLIYDEADQLVERRAIDNRSERYEYNARGELVAATNYLGRFEFHRDVLGRIVREVQNVAGRAELVDINYDAAGRVASFETSLGHNPRFERDAMGMATRTWLDEDHVIDQSRDLLSREVRRRLPKGGVLETSFDAMGQINRRVAKKAGLANRPLDEPEWVGMRDDATTAERTYYWTADNEIQSVSDRFSGLTRYEYDPIGQLLAALPENAAGEFFRYDASGNHSEVSGGSQRRQYDQANHPMRRDSTEYVWDIAGRLAEKRERTPSGEKAWRYEWNGSGLLERVDTPSGERLEFEYDPFSRRVSKRVMVRDGIAWETRRTTRFVWRGDSLIHEVHEATVNAEVTTYVFGDDAFEPIAQSVGLEWEHYFNDPSGAPAALLNDDGTVAAHFSRSAWGDVVDAGASTRRTPWRLLGQYEDLETGLAVSRARYYDAALGRFLTPDPVGIASDLNTTRYAFNAIRWVDPLGLTPLTQTGYSVYGLYHPGATEPYYIGITGRSPAARRHEHQEPVAGNNPTARMMPGDRMRVLDKNVNYGQARGYEQGYIQKYGTLTGWPGNRCMSFAESRLNDPSDTRAATFDANRKQKYP